MQIKDDIAPTNMLVIVPDTEDGKLTLCSYEIAVICNLRRMKPVAQKMILDLSADLVLRLPRKRREALVLVRIPK